MLGIRVTASVAVEDERMAPVVVMTIGPMPSIEAATRAAPILHSLLMDALAALSAEDGPQSLHLNT